MMLSASVRRSIRLPIILVAFLFAPCLLGVASCDAANVLLSENFDAENSGIGVIDYSAFDRFTVTGGSVDLIGNGVADFFPGNGLYVDMDGTGGSGGTLESNEAFQLTPGVRYRLQFDLGNSDGRFGGQENENTLVVSLGSAFSETFIRDGLAPFETIVRELTVGNATAHALRFEQSGSDDIGVLIDNVSLVAIPEPTTLLLSMVGVLLGLAPRRND